MSCNCEGKNYNISMGCCEPVLGPVENYYTKYQIDKMIASAVTSGCCITPEEVDEKIEEAISGITVSGVTEEELNNAIASAKTEIEAEIPTVPTSNTAFTNDAGYLTEHQSLTAYSTTNEVNELINQSVSGKQDTLSAGTGIDITNNVISCTVTGGGEDISACTFHYVGNSPKNTYSIHIIGITPSAVKFKGINPTNSNYNVNFLDERYMPIISFQYNGGTNTWTKTDGDASYTANGDTIIVESSSVVYVGCYGLEFDLYAKYCEEIESAFTNHADNLSIHITPTERSTWNSKVDSSTLNNYLLKSKIWCGTQNEYDSIQNKDSETLYLIHE